MKNFKISLFLSIALCFVPVVSQAQVSSAINATRRVATKVLRKSVTKEASEKAAKEGVETALKKGSKKVVTNKVEKSATGHLVVNGVEAIGRAEAKNAIKEGTEKALSSSIRASVRHSVTSEGAEIASRQLIKKKVSTEVVEDAVRLSLRDAGHVASRQMTKEAAEKVSEQLTRRLGKEAMEQWRKVVPDVTADANRVLLKDLTDNSSFRRLICGSRGKSASPQLLEAYSHMLDAPSVRTRPDVLRYLTNGSDLYHSKGVYKKSIIGVGNDLRVVEHNGVPQIYKAGSNKSIGTMVPNKTKGFDIEVPFDDRTLLNLYPMKNSKYTTTRALGNKGYVKNTWYTDEFGRTKEIVTEVKPDGKFVPIKRDKNTIQSFGKIKKDNTIHGHTPNRPTYINDDSGHMAALQCGGTNDGINLLSQNTSLNKGAWKAGENAAREGIDNGKTVIRRVEVSYPDKVDLRPSSFKVNQNVGGADTIVEQIFENVIEPVL